jgi:hypothetical protein
LIGGRQTALILQAESKIRKTEIEVVRLTALQRPIALAERLSNQEREDHQARIAEFGPDTLWN